MKRLILVTTLALAVTTLGAMPAAATAQDVTAQASTSIDASPDAADDSLGEPDGTSASEGADETVTADSQAESVGGADGTTDPEAAVEADVEGTEDSEGTPTEPPEADPIEASLSLESSEVTVEDIGNPDVGLRFFLDGVLAGDTVAWGDGDGIHATVESDGTFEGTFYTAEELSPGDTVTVTVDVQRGDQSASYSASATVVAGEGETEPPNVTTLDVSPKSQTLDNYLKYGVSVLMMDCHVDSEVEVSITTKYDPDTILFQESQVAGEDAAGAFTYIPEVGDVDPEAFIGEYLVHAQCGDEYQDSTYTVTANGDEELEPTLWVQPETISGVDFVNRDKGVLMTVKDCYDSDTVRFQVWRTQTDELLYDRTAPNDLTGFVSVQTYGLEVDPAAYVGTYTVQAVCGDITMDGRFVVTGSGSGGGGGNGGGSGSMPRTGAELTGLGAGAFLILAGAGAVLFARRRGQLES